MEPTESNRRAWDEIHRRRADAMAGELGIPETILSYRQNMTVMVQDEKFNPYNRTWWGGTPPGWQRSSALTKATGA